MILKNLDQIDKEFTSLIENDTITVCKESHKDIRQFVNVHVQSEISTTQFSSQNEKLPKIYFVTPTYLRREQIAELTRLGLIYNIFKILFVLTFI